MYQEFYGFQEKPFNLTPDPRFIFLSQKHREAIAHLLYGINSHVGFISLTGEVGAGKTTVLRSLLSHLDHDHYRTALIFNPSLSPSGLLRSIGREYGMLSNDEASGVSDSDILEKLNDFLIRENAEKRTVVLVIDEAQNLGADVLEQIRLISNLETDSDKLIQIILAGQPELLDLLRKRNLRQLNQRITVRYHLTPLDLQDTEAYINHRIDVAEGRVVFSRRAIAKIFRYSGGLPRLINAACDRALLAGYTQEAREITGRIAAVAIGDLARQGGWSVLKRPAVLYPLIVFGIVLLAAPFVPQITFVSKDLPGLFWKSGTAVKPGAATAPLKPVKHPAVALNRAYWAKIEQLSEVESFRSAFNEITGLWKADPAGDSEVDPASLEEALQSRGLSLLRFTGTLPGLQLIGCPAIVELALPGKAEKRYAVLTGIKAGKISLAPQIVPDSELTTAELHKYWTGSAYIPWKNFLKLPEKLSPGESGKGVRKLQKLLRVMGIYNQSLTGSYDTETENAIKIFQSTHGLEPDGVMLFPTLLSLYRSVKELEVPSLTGEEPHEPHP